MLLEAVDVSHAYRSRPVLEHVTVGVAPGQALALVGANGAGKTTLLALLGRVMTPTAGRIAGDAERVGLAPQQPAVYPRLTARENLRLFARLADRPATEADELCQDAGIGEFADRRCEHLSVGQRQRVSIAVSLLGDPQVLLLDEPTAALDPGRRAALWSLVEPVRTRGGGLVFTTQLIDEVEAHATHVAVLADGTIDSVVAVAPGTTDHLHDLLAGRVVAT